MAVQPKPADQAETPDAQTEARRKSDEEAAKLAADAADDATEDARKQSLDTLKRQEELRPYPSQEEADAMKSTAASGAAPYVTRQAKP